jgi:hypothetical protein
MHLLKNGHPAHVFTDEDRRKAAAVTNQIRRERAAVVAAEVEVELLNRRRDAALARRARKAAIARERRSRLREQDKIAVWLERGHGARACG